MAKRTGRELDRTQRPGKEGNGAHEGGVRLGGEMGAGEKFRGAWEGTSKLGDLTC